MSTSRRQKCHRKLFGSSIVLLIGAFGIVLSLLCAHRLLQSDIDMKRQAILVLGGDLARVRALPEVMNGMPQADVYISDNGSSVEAVREIIESSNIQWSEITYDCRAVDTVSNFTTLDRTFAANQYGRVVVVTSSDHMPRAMAIGKIVFGTRGVQLDSFAVPTFRGPEPTWKVVRDGMRSLLWLLTGWQFRGYSSYLSWRFRRGFW